MERKASTITVGGRALERVRREAAKNGHQREQTTASLVTGIRPLTGAKKRNREPEAIGNILGTFYSNKQVAKKLLLPQIIDIWEDVVGRVVAEHTTPKAVIEDVLHVNADSSVWATQLSALSQILVNKINTISGAEVITRIQISGPKANVPKYGPRTVKGSIGYRDTFG